MYCKNKHKDAFTGKHLHAGPTGGGLVNPFLGI